MNKIYRIVFNTATGRWVVASEMARGRKKAARGAGGLLASVLIATGGLGAIAPAAHAGSIGNCTGTNNTAAASNANSGWSWSSGASWGGAEGACSTGTGVILSENNTAFGGLSGSQAYLTVGQTGYNAAGTITLYGPSGINLKGATTTTGLATFNLGANMTGDKITSLAAGSLADGSTDAINGDQLFDSNTAIAAAFGGGSTVDASGFVTAPSYALTNANTINGTTGAAADVGTAFVKVDDALGKLDTRTTTNATNISNLTTTVNNLSANPITFTGNDAAAGVVTRKLGETLTIKGAATTAGTYSGANLKTVTDPTNGTINVQMADAPVFAGQVSANGGLKVGAGQTVDMGGNKVINVADGNVAAGSKDAVNGGQLAAVKAVADTASKGWKLRANAATADTIAPDETVSLVDGTNTTASYDATTNQMKVDVVANPTFAGMVTANGGLTVGAGQTIDMGGNKVTNIANGVGNNDAVNVSQLKGVTTMIGGGAAVNADGSIQSPSFSVGSTTGITTVGGAVDALDTRIDGMAANPITFAANSGTNITRTLGQTLGIKGGTAGAGTYSTTNVTTTTDASGNVIIKMADAPTFSGTVTANGGLTVGAGQTVDMGGNKVTNVADGAVSDTSNEAINGSQLYAVSDSVASALGGTATVDPVTGEVTNAGFTVTDKDGVVQTETSVADAFTTVDERVTNIYDSLDDGTVGLVQYDDATETVTVAAGKAGTTVDFTGTAGERKLIGVADGAVSATSNEAINGSQLYAVSDSVATALGGDSVVNADGTVKAPEYKLAGDTVTATNVGDAIDNLDGRTTQNTTDIGTINDTIADLGTTLDGAVMYDDASIKDTVTFGGVGATEQVTLANVKAGVAPTDAVNVSQLQPVVAALGGGAAIDPTTGAVTGPSYTINNIDGTTSAPTTVGGAVTELNTNITNLSQQISDGTVGLVQYDDATETVTVAAGKAGTKVDFRNVDGTARRLEGVAAGAEDEDAVNVAQLRNSLGGEARYDATTGEYLGPTYNVTNADGSQSQVNNVGDAISNIDGRTYANTTAITNLSQQITNGTVGLVQQSAAGENLTVGKDTDGAAVDFTGTAGERKLVGVADGTVAADSKEAVNGGQLHGVSQSVAEALGGGSTVNQDGSITAPQYTVTSADGSQSTVTGVEGAITNLDGRVYQNTQNIANNTQAITNLTQQVNNGGLGLVKQDATTRAITVAKDTDGTSVNFAGTQGDRTLSGVAAGKADNDAVNMGQLKQAGIVDNDGNARSVVSYDDAGKTSLTLGGEGASAPVAIHNVADGVADRDAVNVSQLNQRLTQNNTEVLVQANDYTDQRINDVWTGMDKVARQVINQDRSISRHGAMSMAEAQMASGAAAAAVGNSNGAWSVGLGYERGYGAISAGYAKPVGKKSQISFGAAFSGGERSIGVGFAHKL